MADLDISEVRGRLTAALGTAAVLTGSDNLDAYSRDWSGADPQFPDVVVLPSSTADVQLVLQIAQQHQVPVTPRGLGSGKAGGALSTHGIVMSLERMTGIVEVSASDLLARVRAGTPLSEVQEAVAGFGLMYPPDPGSAHLCSIGGNIACNAGGPRALKYGVTRQWILGLEAVLANGEVIQTGSRSAKQAAGYDLTGLLVGSEGTLGVVTEATLRLRPRPGGVCTALVCFDDARAACEAVTPVFTAGLLPRALELLDEVATTALRDAHSELVPAARAMLIAETDGLDADVALEEMNQVAHVLTKHGARRIDVAHNDVQRERIWGPRRMLSETLRRTAPRKLSEDVAVPRSRIPDLLDALQDIAKRTGIRIAAYGHAGDGNLHVNLLFPADREAGAKEALVEVAKTAVELRGTISGEHGVGFLKRDLLAIEQSETRIDVQRAIKAALDPQGLLNPGKVLPPRRSA